MSNEPAGLPQTGEPGVPADDLVAQLYDELKLLAHARMARERLGHTLTATALVHEASLRLMSEQRLWPGRKLFFIAAAEAMRRVLIDHARRKAARDGGRRAEWPEGDVGPARAKSDDDVLALDEHLSALRRVDEEAHQVVQLRYFAGLTAEQTAELLGVDRRTVTRRWSAARAWLAERMMRVR